MNLNPSLEVERPDTNARLRFIIVPEFSATDRRATLPRSPIGTPGVYQVTFVLAVPGREAFRSDLNLSKMMRSGDSLLRVPPGLHLKVEITNGQDSPEVIFSPNSSGALAQAQIRVKANDFAEAERLACDLVLPILSWWSYSYDAALDVGGYEVLEENTDVRRWVFGCVGKSKAFDPNTSDANLMSKPEYRALFAAYREGLNASNPFYQFLCFYKVVEGVRKLRADRREAAIAAGKDYRDPLERIPDSLAVSESLKEFFRPYLGKKYSRILNELRDLVRNAVAHLDPTADSLVADKSEDVAMCERGVPVIRYLAREMVRNELAATPETASAKIL